MGQKEILEGMFHTFEKSIENGQNTTLLLKNYERQTESYFCLFKEGEQQKDDESERNLICARCLISATRSLFDNECKNVENLKSELKILKPLFCSDKKRESGVERVINERIKKLKEGGSDKISDAVLFMYISLKHDGAKEKRIERSLL